MVTGHSLGGYLAEVVATSLGVHLRPGETVVKIHPLRVCRGNLWVMIYLKCIYIYIYILPETNIAPENRPS